MDSNTNVRQNLGLRHSLDDDLSCDHRRGSSHSRARTAVGVCERGSTSLYEGYSGLVLGFLMLVIWVLCTPADLLGGTPGVGDGSEDPGFVNVRQHAYHLWPDPEPLRNSLSAWGLPGLIHVPTATMVPSGSLDVEYNMARDPDIFRGVDRQRNFNFALGFLPWLTFGGRGTEATNTATGSELARDISANLQLLLLEDKSWWPAVAIGIQDIGGGAAHFRSRYVVLSKSLFGLVRGTVGFGKGPDVLKGPFGGVELALTRFVTLMGEYDTKAWNAGVRLFPLPEKWESYGLPRPTVDVLWQDGRRLSWGIGFRTILGEAKFQAQRAARADKRYHRPDAARFEGMSLQTVSEQLQAELIERGLENVRVSIQRWQDVAPVVVVVEYENRRYNRNELDALGLVLGLAATRTPAVVTHMSVIVKKVNIPVLQFSATVHDYLAFLNEQMTAQTFAQQVHISQQVQWPIGAATVEASTPISNRSWLKLDAFLRPRIETTILTEVGVADLRFSLLPYAYTQFTHGTVVNVRAALHATQPAGFPGPLGDPEVDRVLLHQALRLPLGSWSSWVTGLTQVSIGRFDSEEVGIADETALTLWEGVFFAKGTLARVGPSYSDLNRWVALANGRARYPAWDLTLSVTAGRFLDGDQGVTVDLSRFFGNTEIGIFLRHSDHGSLAGLRFAIPLTLGKELPPWRVRPRLPDVFAYEQRTTVFTERNVIRNDIGRTLTTDHDIERVYWNRDRLYPAYIRQHVDTLKEAVHRWIDETS